MKRFFVVTLTLLMIFPASQARAVTQAEYDEVIKQCDALHQQIVDAGLNPVVEVKEAHLETEVPEEVGTEYTVKEYRWDNKYYFHNDLVIKNTSGRDCQISVSMVYKDKDGNVIAEEEKVKVACEDGYETYWAMSTYVAFDSVEYVITLNDENTYISTQSDLDLNVSIIKNGAIVSVKNIGTTPIRFVELNALFLDKDGKVVGSDIGILTDIDNELKPGKTEMSEITCTKAFAEVKAYAYSKMNARK